MSAITIPNDIILQYDNDNILFTFPQPIMTVPGDNYYYMIYDLAGIISPIRVANKTLTYNLVDGVTPGQTYLFRARVFDDRGNRSLLTSALIVKVPEAMVAAAPIPAPAELSTDFINSIIDNEPIPEDAPQIIVNSACAEEIVYVYSETVLLPLEDRKHLLKLEEPKHVPAVEFSKFIDFKNNCSLANGYQGRIKYDFDTLLKIRMGKVTRSLK